LLDVNDPEPIGRDGPATCTVNARVAAIEWAQVERDLDAQGSALIPGLICRDDCDALAALYGSPEDPLEPRFRSRVVMSRHGFGRGEYKYFAYPLPELLAQLRQAIYPRLVPLANRWSSELKLGTSFPPGHAAYIARCHRDGQTRPTALLLRYGAGDYNCLHQDLYGEHVFPLQVVILLSQPGADFEGGEFVMTEQRPRMQSRAIVLPLQKGDAAIIAVNERPVKGARGIYRVKLRHGVSEVRSGRRYTAGIIFHDAR
jgi:uncharacterized protein